jgi:hypothetical protein
MIDLIVSYAFEMLSLFTFQSKIFFSMHVYKPKEMFTIKQFILWEKIGQMIL